MAISKVYLNSDVQMDVTDTTASQSDVASTKYYYGADGVKKQGSYVVPSAVTQATPTISVNSSTGLITASSTQSAGVVSAGTKSATEQLSTQAAQTLYPSTTDQTISSGKYLTGTQTVKGVLLTNLTAANIADGVTIKVGDSDDDDRIISVTGTFEGGSKGIYGASWDGTSTTSWTRTDDAANFSNPVPYVSGASSYGSPFDDIYPWKDMTIVEDDEAGTMVKIPRFWYLLEQSGSGLSIKISALPQTGYSICPACMDRGDGVGERSYVLVGRYHCANALNTSYDFKSVTGYNPKSSVTRSAARTSIHNLGTKVWQWDWATRFTIWLLYLVEFANWDSQSVIGYGCGAQGTNETMGASDTMPYHTGTMQSARTTYGVGVQYRNIEGLWDNVYDWMDGCYDDANGFNIILDPADFSDSTNGITVGMPSNGLPTAFTRYAVSGTFPLFIATTSGGSATTYSCDYWSYNASNPCICAGASYTAGGNMGLFFSSSQVATSKSSQRGCRSMKLLY